jgi:hypothetical protein
MGKLGAFVLFAVGLCIILAIVLWLWEQFHKRKRRGSLIPVVFALIAFVILMISLFVRVQQ